MTADNAACWKCRQQIDAADNYCRHCGAGQRDKINFYYQQWGVWLLFFVIGPFNLWFLFKSPVISKKWKIIDGIIFGILSIWFCWSFYSAVKNIFGVYSTFLNMPY